MFIFSRIKKGEGQGKENVTIKLWWVLESMKDQINTQHVPLRQKSEEKVRGKELESVWDDTNEWNEESVWMGEEWIVCVCVCVCDICLFPSE